MGSKNVTWEYGPPLSSIRESGAIEQDADVVMMLWGPSDEDIAKEPGLAYKRKVRVAKQRNGMLVTEEFNFQNEIQLFEAIENIQGGTSNWIPAKVVQPVKNFYETDNEEDAPF